MTVNLPAFTSNPPQIHHRKTTFCTPFLPKPPAILLKLKEACHGKKSSESLPCVTLADCPKSISGHYRIWNVVGVQTVALGLEYRHFASNQWIVLLDLLSGSAPQEPRG